MQQSVYKSEQGNAWAIVSCLTVACARMDHYLRQVEVSRPAPTARTPQPRFFEPSEPYLLVFVQGVGFHVTVFRVLLFGRFHTECILNHFCRIGFRNTPFKFGLFFSLLYTRPLLNPARRNHSDIFPFLVELVVLAKGLDNCPMNE